MAERRQKNARPPAPRKSTLGNARATVAALLFGLAAVGCAVTRTSETQATTVDTTKAVFYFSGDWDTEICESITKIVLISDTISPIRSTIIRKKTIKGHRTDSARTEKSNNRQEHKTVAQNVSRHAVQTHSPTLFLAVAAALVIFVVAAIIRLTKL